jgi:phage baseplate assembly protein W
MAKRIFTGFSTRDSHVTRQRTYYDIDLIKRDLTNHFHTRVGERVMRPTWGCRIWDYLMEPMTTTLHDDIVAEVISICQADERLKVISVDVVDEDHALRVEITLNFSPLGVIDTFAVNFERRETARWNGEF